MSKGSFNMDDWVMKVNAIDDMNNLRSVKDYIQFKLRMEVRKEISDKSILIKEQELEALKNKRNKELATEWQPSESDDSIRGYIDGQNITLEQARQIEARLNKKEG